MTTKVALRGPWRGACWCTPYGRDICLWLSKAQESALAGATVVALIPARTDTRWPIVMLLSPTREQAKVLLSYVAGIIESGPILRKLVSSITANSVELVNGVSVEVNVPNYRTLRGRSVACAILDEAAFLRSDDSASPDYEVVAALMPSLGRFGHDSMLLISSTPYSQRGVLYDGWRDNFGQDNGAALCWQRRPRP